MSVAARWAAWERAGRRVVHSTGAPPVTFPAVPLTIRTRIALAADPAADPSSWTWEDISDYVRYTPGITMSEGRPDEATVVQTSQMSLTLDNRDGRFSRRNPLSPYYGQLSRNTPIWVTVDPGSGPFDLAQLFVNEWPTRWDRSGNDSTVSIQCAGTLRGPKDEPLGSAPRRWLEQLTGSTPVAAWTLEDGPLVGTAKPTYGIHSLQPFVGTHPSGAVATYPRWGSGSLAPWLPSVLSMTGSAGLTILRSPVSMSESPTEWAIDFIYASGTDAAGTAIDANPSYLGGGMLGWPQLTLDPGTETVSVSFDGSPETTTDIDGLLFTGLAHHVRWHATQDGADIDWVVYIDGVAVQSGTEVTATLPAIRQFGLVSEVQSGVPAAVGYIAIWTTPASVTDAAEAALGYPGEGAVTRIVRLCQEQGVRLHLDSVQPPSTEQPMGPQGLGSFVSLLREAEAIDGGILYERHWGLAFQPLVRRYNASVMLTIDQSLGQLAEPPESVDDDQRLRNRWTVSRTGGSEDTAEDADSIATEGLVEDAVSLNVETDDQLADQASWRVHLGTVDEDRWPQIVLNFANAGGSQLIPQWVVMPPLGARIRVLNPPDEGPPGPVDAFVEGRGQSVTPHLWTATLATSPASLYSVFVLDNPILGRLDTGGSELALAVDSDDTSWLVATDSGSVVWVNSTDNPTQFPFSAKLGGELVTVTAISGDTSPQTFTVTRSVNGTVKSHPAGTRIRLANVAVA